MTLLMKKPGTDLNDKKTLSAARGVATRRNNQFRKMVEQKFPLFAGELFESFEPDTAEKVIERRTLAQSEYAEILKKRRTNNRETIRRFRKQCRELCRDDREFFRLIRKRIGSFGGRSKWNRWYGLLCSLKKRWKPLSETADLILAWLEQEAEPVTHFDLWRRRGDGLNWREISRALNELCDRELIFACPLKKTQTDDGREINAGSYILPEKFEEKFCEK